MNVYCFSFTYWKNAGFFANEKGDLTESWIDIRANSLREALREVRDTVINLESVNTVMRNNGKEHRLP